MLKKLLLAASTLGLVLVAFAIYSRQFGAARPARVVAGGLDATRPLSPTTTAAASGLRVGQAGAVGPGEKPFVQIFDDYGRLKAQFRAQRWEPLAEDEFALTSPEVWLFMPAGQMTHIIADQGRVIVQQVARSNVTPRRGWLRGHVRVFIDRTTSRWRQQNPDRARPQQHPESIIHIWLDQVQFDMDLAQLSSQGPLRVQSAEAEIEGQGLLLQWNELDNRIELLRIDSGKRMELRRSGLVKFVIPGSGQELEIPAQPERPETSRPPGLMAMAPVQLGDEGRPTRRPAELSVNRPAQVAAGPSGRLAAATSRPAERSRSSGGARQGRATLPGRKKIKVQTYRAIFRQNVSVVQQDRLQTTGQLTADRLELLFDFGPQQRRFSAVEPTTRPRGSPGRPARSDQTRIVVTWSGPMEMRPVAASPAEQTGDRFEVIAVGQPVRVADRQGQAICSKLVFHNQSERVWLYGSAEQPVEMSSGPNRRLVGQHVFFDRRRGIARIEGPGRMTDVRQQPPPLELGRARRYRPDRDRKPVQVRWSGGVELALGRQTLRRRLPEGRTVLRVRQYIERADFTGAVQMTQADQSIAANRITLDFAAPAADQRLPETIRRLRAGGNVILLRRYDRISCQSLVVQMGLDEAGRSVPRKAHALGQVVARQGQRVIRADEMIATIGPVAGQPGAGQDVGRQLAITELQAYRQVAVHDPDQSLDVAAEELHCKLTGGRQIETALVVGRPGDDAQVRLGDYQLRAARINIDLTSQRADVNCPGQLRFVTRQDLVGRRLDEPAPVTIHWTDRMTLRGADNVGWFVGRVRAVSRTNVMHCHRLRVDFQDLPPPPAGRVAARPADPLWIFRSLLPRSMRQDQSRPLTRRVRKKPAYVMAEGDVVALSYSLDRSGHRRLSSMRVAGPRMLVDLVKNQLDVIGAGTILIEDYHLPRRGQTEQTGPGALLGELGRQGPSQTALTWGESMTLFSDENMAVLYGGVHMVHRAGTELALAKDLAAAMKLDVKRLAFRKGRRATLTCQQLIVQFARRGRAARSVAAIEQARATDLQRVEATGNVHLQEGDRSVLGDRLIYDRRTDVVTIRGAGDIEARILEQDERSGRLRLIRGRLLRWYRRTNRIEAPGAHILAAP